MGAGFARIRLLLHGAKKWRMVVFFVTIVRLVMGLGTPSCSPPDADGSLGRIARMFLCVLCALVVQW